jgi:cell division protease FtsH
MEPGKPVRKETGGEQPPMRWMIIWLVMMGVFLAVYQFMSTGQEKYKTVPFRPDFMTMVNEGKVSSCVVIIGPDGRQYIRGESLDVDKQTKKPSRFEVNVPITEYLQKILDEKKIHYKFDYPNNLFMQILTGPLSVLIVMIVLSLLFWRQIRMAGRGAMSFGKSRARLMTREKNKTTFKDVAGVDEAREEVQEIIDFLRDPKKFQKLGGRIPKGVLLVGPPGTGKTLLAKAIAGEAEVPFFSISGSDFVEMFVGVGASRVRDMFEQGKKSAPCIIFIDEIDAVGRSRFSGVGGGHDEREQTLNALLVEMDGFDTQEGVIIIAATNRPDVLDQALLRPGRFDRQIVIDLPALDGREAILKIHAQRVKLATTVDLRRVARGTPGFSGADLANLINEAALLAARRGMEAIQQADMEEARDKVRWGRERRSRVLDEKEKKLTAYHEAGHAIVLNCVEEAEPLHKVTIIPRGQALGATMQLPEKDRYTEGRKKLEGMLSGLMGGRVAEEIVFGDITTGAQSDIKQATRIARLMVCEWGMSPTMGPQNFSEREESMFSGLMAGRSQDISEDTARRIDEEVSRLLREAHQRATELLQKHRDKLDLLTQLLIERETLDGVEVAAIVKHGRMPTPEELAEIEAAQKALTPQPPPPPAVTAEPPPMPPAAATPPPPAGDAT